MLKQTYKNKAKKVIALGLLSTMCITSLGISQTNATATFSQTSVPQQSSNVANGEILTTTSFNSVVSDIGNLITDIDGLKTYIGDKYNDLKSYVDNLIANLQITSAEIVDGTIKKEDLDPNLDLGIWKKDASGNATYGSGNVIVSEVGTPTNKWGLYLWGGSNMNITSYPNNGTRLGLQRDVDDATVDVGNSANNNANFKTYGDIIATKDVQANTLKTDTYIYNTGPSGLRLSTKGGIHQFIDNNNNQTDRAFTWNTNNGSFNSPVDRLMTLDEGGNLSVDGEVNWKSMKWDRGENVFLKGAGEFSMDFDDNDGNDYFHVWSPTTGSNLRVYNNKRIVVGNIAPSGNLDDSRYPAIAIGDSDTGFRQHGDGVLEVFANNQIQQKTTSAGTYFWDDVRSYSSKGFNISYDSDNAKFGLRHLGSDNNPIEIRTEDVNDDGIILTSRGHDVANFKKAGVTIDSSDISLKATGTDKGLRVKSDGSVCIGACW